MVTHETAGMADNCGKISIKAKSQNCVVIWKMYHLQIDNTKRRENTMDMQFVFIEFIDTNQENCSRICCHLKLWSKKGPTRKDSMLKPLKCAKAVGGRAGPKALNKTTLSFLKANKP